VVLGEAIYGPVTYRISIYVVLAFRAVVLLCSHAATLKARYRPVFIPSPYNDRFNISAWHPRESRFGDLSPRPLRLSIRIQQRMRRWLQRLTA